MISKQASKDYECGMPLHECTNTKRPGEHETFTEAMACVHQSDPTALKKYGMQ